MTNWGEMGTESLKGRTFTYPFTFYFHFLGGTKYLNSMDGNYS